ncbi:hypothetical protein C8R44DRAFT_729564 [Mycena epipterygia]|nr:hypothetical protein C8R44DRAFT_729564 [Mycena epipterygia]
MPCTPSSNPWRSRSPPSLPLNPPGQILPRDLERLVGRFMLEDHAFYVPEERGIMSIIENIRSRVDLHVPATIENLTQLSPTIFTSEMCAFLTRYYDALHGDPSYGPCDGFGALEVADVFTSIFHDLIEVVHREHFRGYKERMKETEQVRGSAETPEGASSGSHDSRSGSGGEGTDRGRAVGAGRGRRGKAGRGRGEEAGHGQVEATPQLQREPNPFMDLSITCVTVSESERYTTCHDQAMLLSRKIQDNMSDLPKFRYIETTDDEDLKNGGKGTLYHATRYSYLSTFQLGVNPIANSHPNFFSSAPSFNLADTVEQAVSYVLHGKPTTRIDGILTDPIMVFAFQVDLQSIFGSNTGYVGMDPPGGFLNDVDAEWVTSNRKRRGKDRIHEIEFDFVVGPVLTPVQQPSGEDRYKISNAWTETGAQPIHVAAVSRDAFAMLTECLSAIVTGAEQIFVEKESEGTQG